MTVKRLMLLIITAFMCQMAAAQLVFDVTRHDLGILAEEGGKRSCTFRATNKGAQPVLLVDVVTTCGCTVPEFSRKPILPGKTTEIVVTYDPYGRPGRFNRKLHLYGAGNERLGELSITGEVTPRPRSIEELYPIDLGDGVRLNSTQCTFTYIYVGRSISSALSVVNSSDEPRRLDVIPKHSSGLLQVEPPTILQPGERAAINFRYEIPADSPRYGTVRDVMALRVDGRPSEKVLLTHGVAIDVPTKIVKENPPKVEVSENMLKFGAVKHADNERRLRFVLRNGGRSDLMVRAVECSAPFATDLVAGVRLKAGEEIEAELSIRPREGEYGFVTGQLMIVTNDPERPLRRVRVNAVVED